MMIIIIITFIIIYISILCKNTSNKFIFLIKKNICAQFDIA